MSEFVNRVSSDLNKRTLKVIDERLKGNGEIDELDVEIVRMNGEVEREGTPLDADVFNEIIKKMIDESPMVEAQRKILTVKNSLSIPLVVSTGYISLPTSGSDHTTIQWTSSNPNIIATNGTINKSTSDVNVTLTAIISLGEYTAVKSFDVLVQSFTDSERVNYDKASLSVPSRVDDDFNLDLTGTRGSDIRWSSSNTNRIYISGGTAVVDRASTDVTVTLTATISYGDYEATEEFDVIVSGNAGGSQYTQSCSFSGYDISLNYRYDQNDAGFVYTPQTNTDIVITPNGGDGIVAEFNNPYPSYFDVSYVNLSNNRIAICLEESSYNMPDHDSGYEFEVIVKNLNNVEIARETITIAYI